MSPLYKAAAWLADYVYAGWRQLRGWVSLSKAEEFLEGELAPVLVLPGVYEHWRFMLPLIRELHGQGHPVHIVDALRDNRAPVVAGARIADDYLAERDLHDVVIVAHSKGGLIGKHVMGFGESADRVRTMVAIATPFAGSRYAHYFVGRTMRDFRSDDETITLLTGTPAVNQRIVSVFARFDPHIPESSELAGARNVRIAGSGHFRILRHPDARAEVLRVVAE